MKISRQQITSRGIAQQSGLDTLSSIINYTGEFINWGYFPAYQTQLDSDTDYATASLNPETDALINSPATFLNKWYRYHTSGGGWQTTTSPTSSLGLVSFYGATVGVSRSHSGMYQRLLGLTVKKQYEISVQTVIGGGVGNLYINTYSPNGSDDPSGSPQEFQLNSSFSVRFPIISKDEGISKSTFIAETSNDIVLLYFVGESEGESGDIIKITNISIKEKQEYLVPVYANDIYGNAHKVLRIAADQTIPTDET